MDIHCINQLCTCQFSTNKNQTRRLTHSLLRTSYLLFQELPATSIWVLEFDFYTNSDKLNMLIDVCGIWILFKGTNGLDRVQSHFLSFLPSVAINVLDICIQLNKTVISNIPQINAFNICEWRQTSNYRRSFFSRLTKINYISVIHLSGEVIIAFDSLTMTSLVDKFFNSSHLVRKSWQLHII